jgi:hypothetical protein
LQGEITIGLYTINPCTQRCKWVAIDADYKNAMEDLLKLEYYLWQDKVTQLVIGLFTSQSASAPFARYRDLARLSGSK